MLSKAWFRVWFVLALLLFAQMMHVALTPVIYGRQALQEYVTSCDANEFVYPRGFCNEARARLSRFNLVDHAIERHVPERVIGSLAIWLGSATALFVVLWGVGRLISAPVRKPIES